MTEPIPQNVADAITTIREYYGFSLLDFRAMHDRRKELRDKFAGQALQGLLSNRLRIQGDNYSHSEVKDDVYRAYCIADEMLAEREKNQ